MTKEEIMKLEGRELDAAVAEKVIGWAVVMDVVGGEKSGLINGNIFSSIPSDWKTVPTYSTDISAAWEVLELFPVHEIGRGSSGYDVSLVRRRQYGKVESQSTMTEAICRAALLAVMEVDI